jgi:dolichol-phosphate mannosyltransferase
VYSYELFKEHLFIDLENNTENINLDRIKFVGYAFQIEMKYRAFVLQFVIQEVPIIFTDRTKGQSKMSGGLIREAVVGVIMLRLRKIFNKL